MVICVLACMINVCIMVSLILFYNTSHCNFNISQNVTAVSFCQFGTCYYLEIVLLQVIYNNERVECHCTCWKTSVVQPFYH